MHPYLQVILWAAGIVVLFIILMAWNNHKWKKAQKNRIKRIFGKIPEREYSPDDLIDLLNEELTLFNKQHMDSYQIAISYGISEYDASSTTPIESFIKQADAEMYRDKKRNQIN